MVTDTYQCGPKERLPNSRFPLLIHRGAIPGGGEATVRQCFLKNGWLNNWSYPGIYEYSHFHSTTHECLGCAVGWMDLLIFGKDGERVRVEAGDVVVMPAGVSHEMIGHSDDVLMVGGYPDGRDWDNIQEAFLTEEAFKAAAKRIMMLPIPSKDPVSGEPIASWLEAPSSVDGGWNDYRDSLDASS
ncbi:MAG: hypothetical protein AB8B79_14450 [Granulosicoccus sp.]